MKWEMGHEETDEGDWNKIKLADGGNRFRNMHRNRVPREPNGEEI